MQIYSFSPGSICQIYRVTDEALIAETAVWPNFFLMNIFSALEGSKLLITVKWNIFVSPNFRGFAPKTQGLIFSFFLFSRSLIPTKIEIAIVLLLTTLKQ